jgi:hypothetical protein
MSKILKILFSGLFILVTLELVTFFVQKQTPGSKFVSEDSVKLPTKVEASAPISDSSVDSPDGKKTLTMKTQVNETSKTYSFYSGTELLFSKTLMDGKMSIPLNSWSPDNKYTYVIENVGEEVQYYLLPQQLNISQLFREKNPDYKLQEITGWGGVNLLIVNANDGKNDVSMWFDVGTKGFIKLSNRFH